MLAVDFIVIFVQMQREGHIDESRYFRHNTLHEVRIITHFMCYPNRCFIKSFPAPHPKKQKVICCFLKAV